MQAGKLWIEFYSNPAEWDILKSCSTVPVTQLLQIANGEIDSVFYDTDPGDLEEGSLFLQITKVQAEGRRNP